MLHICNKFNKKEEKMKNFVTILVSCFQFWKKCATITER